MRIVGAGFESSNWPASRRNMLRVSTILLLAVTLINAQALFPSWAGERRHQMQDTPSASPSMPRGDGTWEADAKVDAPSADESQLPAYLHTQDFASAVPDPWERYNRRVFALNNALDRSIARPIARVYVRMAPKPVREGITHFFVNLQQPLTSLNLLLQGHPAASASAIGRFSLNSTIGVVGIFDPATHAHVPLYHEDFGQTMARWGWHESRYFLLPLLGPGTLRDRVGTLGEISISPFRYIDPASVRAGLFGLSQVDGRARALYLDDLIAGTDDKYALIRDAWEQHRNYEIENIGDGVTEGSRR